jgi:uncharacterized membrane protein
MMKASTKAQCFLFVVALIASNAAHATRPGEGIVQDSNGDYLITYWDDTAEPPQLMQTTFVPATKIDPTIRSQVSLDRGKIAYRYTVASGKRSKQILGLIIFDPAAQVIAGNGVPPNYAGLTTQQETTALAAPNGWYGSLYSSRRGNGARVGWSASAEHQTGIKAGETRGGFGFFSYALPGVGTAELSGDSPVFGYSGEGPDLGSDIKNQIERLQLNNFVPRTAAVPTIAVPNPFSAATVLGSIQSQMHGWIAMNLLDASFSAQLDRYFAAAINAYSHNQPKAGKENIEELRKMLKREQKDLDRENEHVEERDRDRDGRRAQIDLLAAQVLDFDLKYLLQRTEESGGRD